MADQPYQRVSVFREEAMFGTEDEQPAQRLIPTDQAHTHRKFSTFNYKPVILRHYSLLGLLVVTLALISLLEYAVVVLPDPSTQVVVKARGEDALSPLERRQQSYHNSSTPALTTVEATLESAYVDTDSTTMITSTTRGSAYVQSSSTSTIAYQIQSSAYVQGSSTLSAVEAAVSSAYLEITGSMKTSQSSQPTPVTHFATRSEYVPSQSTASITLATTATSAFVSTHSTGGNRSAIPESLVNEGKDGLVYHVWDAERTFLGTYLAVLIAVVYRMLWMIAYNNFNLIDPFLHLMQPGGAPASSALLSFYQSQSNFLGPIPAFIRRRWILALVGSTYTIACFLPAFASESIFVDTNWGCENPNTSHKNNPCNPRIAVNTTTVRIIQSLLAFAAAALVGIIICLVFRTTGLHSDPRSLATVGSLMQHPALIDDLNEIPAYSNWHEMECAMADKSYKLGYYRCTSGEEGYGISPMTGESLGVSGHGRFKYMPVKGRTVSTDRARFGPSRFRIMDVLLAIVTLGSFAVVLAYYLDGSSDGFNDFFNSNTFGPRFILTLAGTVTASMFKSIEQKAVVMAAYIRMARNPSLPRRTILFIPSSTPLSSTWRSFSNGYVLVTAISLVTLLAEVLNITIGGVPYASGQTRLQFLISTYVSIAVLGIMILVSTLVIIGRFREPRIPRTPDTLGAVMSYMSGSRMLDDFAGMENTESATRDRLIVQSRKTYEFKEALRIDGIKAWKVDETSKHDSYYS